MSIENLLELRRANMLDVNAEYQRGAVWSKPQQKKLIDSILRGYPIPLIYLHDIKREVAGKRKENYEIIDGQQRLNALYDFAEGAFELFDPKKDDKIAKFPRFVKEAPCPWAGKRFASLDPELQSKFKSIELPVVLIETDNTNEVRDLFVRLQSGLPLNAQETRDSWPGDFTDFVLGLGGKSGVARYPGHPFFTDLLGMKPANDRGKARQLAAQIAMIYFTRRESPTAALPDISASAINDFYYAHVDFERESPDALRLIKILDRLTAILRGGDRPKMRGHDAIHLVLLADLLWDDFAPGWQARLPLALDRFLEGVAKGKETAKDPTPSEFWSRYAQWTRVNSDRGSHIRLRHEFYLERMSEWLAPLQPKDPNRSFSELDRTLLYYKLHKRCDVCGEEVLWADAEVHHVLEHSEGGPTVEENAALVHRQCHPRSEADVRDFASRFEEVKKKRPTEQQAAFVEALEKLDLDF